MPLAGGAQSKIRLFEGSFSSQFSVEFTRKRGSKAQILTERDLRVATLDGLTSFSSRALNIDVPNAVNDDVTARHE